MELPENRLFQGVVWQAFRDACTPNRGKDAVRERDWARAWLLGRSDDFRLICELGGFDPDFVLFAAMRTRDAGWPVIEPVLFDPEPNPDPDSRYDSEFDTGSDAVEAA